jgi:uncharacterized protein YqiB (DUF1249 family)
MPHKKRYVVDFPRYMSDCECNYRRLRRLMPGWRESSNSSNRIEPGSDRQWRYLMGNSSHEMATVISVQDSAKYTTTARIEVFLQLPKPMPWDRAHSTECSKKNRREPSQTALAHSHSDDTKTAPHRYVMYSLDIHLYHDAVLAEVIAWQKHRRFQPKYEYPNIHMHQRDEKSQINQFLSELLAFCLSQGRVNRPIASMAGASY